MQSQQNSANSDKKISSLEVLKELKCDEQNVFPKSTKDANKFGDPTIQQKDMKYLLIELK